MVKRLFIQRLTRMKVGALEVIEHDRAGDHSHLSFLQTSRFKWQHACLTERYQELEVR